jgi:hypothetical protein
MDQTESKDQEIHREKSERYRDSALGSDDNKQILAIHPNMAYNITKKEPK